MYKGVIGIIVLSVAVVFTSSYCTQALQFILHGHAAIDRVLYHVFSTDKTGVMIAQLISYLILPFAIASIFALLYGLMRHHLTPYFMHIAWAVWLVQTTALLVYS